MGVWLAASVLLNTTPAQQGLLLKRVGALLEQQHYLRPAIDDQFSEDIWNAYVNSLDTRKNIFLQEDIQQLQAYRLSLDNELHGDSIRFFPAITKLFARRYGEASTIWEKGLSHPFVFHDRDSIFPDQTYADFPANEAERVQRWNNFLRQRVFERFIMLQEQRGQAKPGDATYRKTDKQLEQMARESLLRQQNRLLARFHTYSEDKLFAGYLNAIVHCTDPHSDYFPPIDKQAFEQSMANRFFGIGAQLREDEEGNILIDALDAGSPSWKSGLLAAGDRIVKIGQGTAGPFTEVEGMPLTDVVRLIRGEKGSTVRIGCRKSDGRSVTVPLVREEIRPEEAAARSAVIYRDGKKTGYIYLPAFYDDFTHAEGAHCADDVEREVKRLMAEQVQGIIIDLRNNGGGSLAQVVRMAGLFVGQGPVVQVRGSNNQLQVLVSERPALYNGPLTVMVNEFSASASEIFAAAIQDYQRGVIIGSATLGKGTVQRTLLLGEEEYGAVKLTTQKFYRINGGSTQLKGVIPDVELPDSYETMEIREGYRPAAMDWDRIPSAAYTIKDSLNIEQLTMQVNEKTEADKRFDTIRQGNVWLEQFRDEHSRGMLLQQFRGQLQQRALLSRQLAAVVVLPGSERLDVRGAKEQWAEKVAKDIYIKQALYLVP